MGNKYQEKYYQRAVALGLKQSNLEHEREAVANLTYKGEKIGKYYLDFVIENKIVLELKATPQFKRIDFKQVRAYLKAKNMRLGILATFRGEKLVYKRILNKI
jgi:GxxExxY protein